MINRVVETISCYQPRWCAGCTPDNCSGCIELVEVKVDLDIDFDINEEMTDERQ